MAITTTPTNGMKDLIAAAFVTEFDKDPPPKTVAEIKAALAEVIAVAIEQALKEVKNNADVTGVTSGSDTVTGGVD